MKRLDVTPAGRASALPAVSRPNGWVVAKRRCDMSKEYKALCEMAVRAANEELAGNHERAALIMARVSRKADALSRK